MLKESDGQNNELLKWALRTLVALGSLASWFIRFLVIRYYDRKEKAKERELEELLAEDIKLRKKAKSHTNSE